MMKPFLIFLCAQLFCTIAKAQPATTKQILQQIIKDNKNPELVPVFVLDQFIGGEESFYRNDQVYLDFLVKKAVAIMDSLKIGPTALEKKTIFADAVTYKAQILDSLPGVTLTQPESNPYSNLMAGRITYLSGTPPAQIEEMRQRRLKYIVENTPIAEQIVFQFSIPFFYNSGKKLFVLMMVTEPGTNSFYVCSYRVAKGAISKQVDKLLIYAENN